MPSSPVRTAVAQIACQHGDVAANLEFTEQAVREAERQDVQLLAFPELSLSGYVCDERTERCAMRLDDARLLRVARLSETVALAVGFVEETQSGLLYNSSAFFASGRLLHVHRKLYPPTYGSFDEGKVFARGERFSAFDTPFGRMAMLICADAWHPSLPYLAAHDGADVLIVMAASPLNGVSNELDSVSAWERLNRTHALTLGSYLVFANHAGRDDAAKTPVAFTGRSHIADPLGELLCEARGDTPELITGELCPAKLRRQRLTLPFRRDDRLDLALSLGQQIDQSRKQRDIPVLPVSPAEDAPAGGLSLAL